MTPELRERLECFVAAIIEENQRQNLIAKSTVDDVWVRHILDSLQLFALGQPGHWLDVGSGPGLPGIVLALAGAEHVTMVEPRRKRVDFILKQVDALDLAGRATVMLGKVETLPPQIYANISARAVAGLSSLFELTTHYADGSTRWVLPKGRSAADELAKARSTWQGAFRLVPSQTDAAAAIVVADGVKRKGR